VTKKIQAIHEAIEELRSRVAKAPTKPGIYKWLGKNEEVLYIGKAKNLKNRLKSYLQKQDTLLGLPTEALAKVGPWKLALIGKITDVDWTVTETEIEALILETNLIKEIKPKYNVMMKDDKNYVYVRITIKDAYPSFSVVRLIEDDGAKYFGPFLAAHKINRTLDMLHTVYNFRACKRSIDLLNKAALSSSAREASGEKPILNKTEEPLADSSLPLTASLSRAERSGVEGLEESKLKPCLDAQIGKCCGLCARKVTGEE